MFRPAPNNVSALAACSATSSRSPCRAISTLVEGVGLSTAACMCTRQLQSPRSRNECRRLCRATPSGCGVVQCANVKLVERARHLQDYFRMRCREFGRRRRLPRSKIADAPRRDPVPHQKKFKKTKSCWGPLFIILIKRAGAGSRSVQVFNHLV